MWEAITVHPPCGKRLAWLVTLLDRERAWAIQLSARELSERGFRPLIEKANAA